MGHICVLGYDKENGKIAILDELGRKHTLKAKKGISIPASEVINNGNYATDKNRRVILVKFVYKRHSYYLQPYYSHDVNYTYQTYTAFRQVNNRLVSCINDEDTFGVLEVKKTGRGCFMPYTLTVEEQYELRNREEYAVS